MAQVFLGSLMLVPYNFAPYGFALCQGQILAISQYTALFSLLGTTYGGNGTSNFALPNLQGRLAVSAGQAPGMNAYSLGDMDGSSIVPLQVNEVPAHIHAVMGTDGTAAETATLNNGFAKTTLPISIYSDATKPIVQMNKTLVSVYGNNQSHNNMMPYTTLNWIIALQGIFPQRS